eukprot:TRINITY_DN28793_c0_g1_i1.p1 TRINITY_DN28793_c0_g1~~TRINITY_DN28793_c0_g1_i1.p1  ORF type:complete len:549 (+),score=152.02 TRINITY_DN28793_c0_g1_i1:59-1705(+)
MPPKKKKGDDALTAAQREEKKLLEDAISRLSLSGVVVAGFSGPAGPPQSRVSILDSENCEKVTKRMTMANPTGKEPNAWTLGPNLATPRWSCGAANLGNGRMLVVGGFDEFGAPLDTTEIVDLVHNTCYPGPQLAIPRAGCAAVDLPLPYREKPKGKPGMLGSKRPGTTPKGTEEEKPFVPWIMVIGGYSYDAAQSTEVLDVEAMTSRPGPPLLTPRTCCAASMYCKRRVIVAGGFGRQGVNDTTEFLDLHTMKPTAVAEPHIEEDSRSNSKASQASKSKGSKNIFDDEEEEETKQKDKKKKRSDGDGEEGESQGEEDKSEEEEDEEEAEESEEEQEEEEEKEQPFSGPQSSEQVSQTWFVPGPRMLERRAGCAIVKMLEHEKLEIPEKLFVLGGTNEKGERLRTSETLVVEEIPDPHEADDDEEDQEQLGERKRTGSEEEGSASASAEAEDDEGAKPESEPEVGFEPGPLMHVARTGFVAVRMGLETFMVAGGLDPDGNSLESSENYSYENPEPAFLIGPPLSFVGQERESGVAGGFSYCTGARVIL